MFEQAGRVTLAVLLFRAGPQDFPYSAALTRVVVAITLVVSYLQYQLTLPLAAAVVHAVTSVAVLALVSRAVLQMRRLLNRTQQTVNALFASGSVLTLLSLGPLSALAPHVQRLQQNPDLMESAQLPALPALALMAFSIWNFLVAANIYRHALDVRPVFGGIVALASTFVTVTMASAVTSLLVR